MSKKPKCTIKDLPGELLKLPKSDLRDMIIEEAKAGEYHDYKNTKYVCGKTELVMLLAKLDGADDIRNEVLCGVYDEMPDAEDKKMISDLLAKMAKEAMDLVKKK